MTTMRAMHIVAGLCLFLGLVHAQMGNSTGGACTGNVTITSQADISNSSLTQCTTLNGDLLINNCSDVITLPGNAKLITVNGSVLVQGNLDLNTVNLTTITNITQNLYLEGNGNLTLLAMPSLEFVGGTLYEVNNSNFMQTPGFFPYLKSAKNINVIGPFGSISFANESFTNLTYSNSIGVGITNSSGKETAYCGWFNPTNSGPTPQSWQANLSCELNSTAAAAAPGTEAQGSMLWLVVFAGLALWWL